MPEQRSVEGLLMGNTVTMCVFLVLSSEECATVMVTVIKAGTQNHNNHVTENTQPYCVGCLTFTEKH